MRSKDCEYYYFCLSHICSIFFLTRKEAQFQWRASVKLTHDGTSKPCALFYQWALSAKQVASQADYFTVGYHRQQQKNTTDIGATGDAE